MRIAFAVFALMGIVSGAHAAVDLDALRQRLETSNASMDVALTKMRDACVGISSDLDKLKTLAGVGTTVSAVGTVAGGVAVYGGVKKSQVDSVNMYQNSMEVLWASWRGGDKIKITPRMKKELYEKIKELTAGTDNVDYKKLQDRLQDSDLGQKSEKLGDVRTGMLAAATATNVAGAALAGVGLNKSKVGLTARVASCLAAGKELNNAWGQVRINKMSYDSALEQAGKNTQSAENLVVSNDDMARIETIIRVCEEWAILDLSKIDGKATGALVSNVIGAGAGAAGVATSAVANGDEMRYSGTKKEEKLNTASNVLAGTATAAGAVATLFNASQINTIKRASMVANACEGALK